MSSTIPSLQAGANPNQALPIPQLGGQTAMAGILINDVTVDPDTGDAYFSDSPNCREDSAAHRLRSDQCFLSPDSTYSGIMKVTMPTNGAGPANATVSVWYWTAEKGALCPLGYGQNSTNGPIIQGNGLSIYKNPSTGAKTLVMVFSLLNSFWNFYGQSQSGPQWNAVKIGIDGNGSPVWNEPNSKMLLNRIGMDGARFLNPMRPGDLYISSFQFNAPYFNWASSLDAKVAVQVVQFSAAQLSPNASVPSGGPTTLKYCNPSAGQSQIVPSVTLPAVPSQSNLQIKLYNSVDCNPTKPPYPTASDPANLGLLTTNPIVIPYQSNACNNYNRFGSTSSSSFKMRCLAGEMANGIYGAQTYLFKDFPSTAACVADSLSNPNPLNTGGSMIGNMVAGT
jgi:hypothetical protein